MRAILNPAPDIDVGEDEPLPSDFDLAPNTGIAALYLDAAPGLLRSLSGKVRERDDARDLVQESFVRLIQLGPRRIAAIAREQPRAYLDRIATNLLRDRARQAARRQVPIHVPADGLQASFDPHAGLEARDTLRRLEYAVARLKPKTRSIFLAHRIEGLSYAEIAARTGLTVKGVEKQMSRAIAAIDRQIERSGLS